MEEGGTNLASVASLKRKRKSSLSVAFREGEEIINPEDIDPTVGKFRNMIQTTLEVPNKKMRGPVSPMGNLPVPREKRLGKYSGARDDRVRDDWIADAERAVRGSRVERLSGVPETSKDVRVKRWAKNRAKLVSKPRFSSCYRSGKDGHFVRDCPEPALATRTKEGRRSALKKPAGNVKSRSGSPLPRMVGGTPTRTAKMAGVELSAW